MVLGEREHASADQKLRFKSEVDTAEVTSNPSQKTKRKPQRHRASKTKWIVVTDETIRTPTQDELKRSIARDSARNGSIPAQIPLTSFLDDIATANFFHHYVSPIRSFFRLDMDYFSAVIDHAVGRDILAEVVVALGILTLPNQSPTSRLAARSRYTHALQLTNVALADREKSKSDAVLLAIILLGQFETTPDEFHSMANYATHLNGARMLLRSRHQRLAEHTLSYRIFSFLRMQLLLNCFMTMQPVHPDLLALCQEATNAQDGPDRAASQLMALFARLCNLQALLQRNPQQETLWNIMQLRALDQALVQWSKTVPHGFSYTRTLARQSAKAFSTDACVYTSMFAAEAWNLFRTTRIWTNGKLLEQYEACKDHEAVLEKSELICNITALRTEICDTVPYLLHKHGGPIRSATQRPLCCRTPVVHTLLSQSYGPGVSEKMSTWVAEQLAELQSDSEIDQGAIWMNNDALPSG